jgi:hypothetical protein
MPLRIFFTGCSFYLSCRRAMLNTSAVFCKAVFKPAGIFLHCLLFAAEKRVYR